MLTMVYTTLSYTVVYNLFFFVVCDLFVCLWKYVFDMFELGWLCNAFGGEIQAASLRCF